MSERSETEEFIDSQIETIKKIVFSQNVENHEAAKKDLAQALNIFIEKRIAKLVNSSSNVPYPGKEFRKRL